LAKFRFENLRIYLLIQPQTISSFLHFFLNPFKNFDSCNALKKKNIGCENETNLIFITMNIYVGNLDFRVEENDLQEAFQEYGSVSSAKIITDKFTGRSKGFGFVEMDDNESANKAINELNGSQLEDRDMVVNEARPRKTNY